MGALRKPNDPIAAGLSYVYGGSYVDVTATAPEAFAYEDDVRPEVVRQLQIEADKFLDEGEWVIIDGYVGER